MRCAIRVAFEENSLLRRDTVLPKSRARDLPRSLANDGNGALELPRRERPG